MQAHYNTLLRLKQYFPFSLIDAMGTLDGAHCPAASRYLPLSPCFLPSSFFLRTQKLR